jgi:hypothetical protein
VGLLALQLSSGELKSIRFPNNVPAGQGSQGHVQGVDRRQRGGGERHPEDASEARMERRKQEDKDALSLEDTVSKDVFKGEFTTWAKKIGVEPKDSKVFRVLFRA